MPLIRDRQAVLDAYAQARQLKRVIPAFCSENQTTTEAVLSAALAHGQAIGESDLPITIGITNLYGHRSQSLCYSHTADWRLGLRMLLADLEVLTAPDSPFADLRVMLHLDHVQPDLDKELLGWDMGLFSSIMFDASASPIAENMAATARFVEAHGRDIVIEGACDEIVESGSGGGGLTAPEAAERFVQATGVDLVVANLGTEHRAGMAERHYRGDLARQISARIGSRIVLHGCSSVPPAELAGLAGDGICKVNLWTCLERDSSGPLLGDLLRHASQAAGPAAAQALYAQGLLGEKADRASAVDLAYCTTTHRQALVFAAMRDIVLSFLQLWCREV